MRRLIRLEGNYQNLFMNLIMLLMKVIAYKFFLKNRETQFYNFGGAIFIYSALFLIQKIITKIFIVRPCFAA